MTQTLSLAGVDLRLLFGQSDVFLRLIESNFDAQITARGEQITFTGSASEVAQLTDLFADLIKRLETDDALTDQYIRYAINIIKEGGPGPAERLGQSAQSDAGDISYANGIKPRTIGQSEYVEAIDRSDIVFAIGPAGTGKTFLAVAAAVARLKAGSVKRIILVRPAVEAGETLGFLPGDIRAKVDPYLRPVYDALNDLLSPTRVKKLMENNVIEIAPLAFMRGRTLNNAFVVLDEAQNSTTAQMKMFLTRLGENSKAVVTGDVTQIDLINPDSSGLLSAQRILAGIDGLEFVRLTEKDVVRHRLVQKIILAYEGKERG
ncbi:MAG TPA: PhoH family protein [candidate division Zixibacteria bacterium]|nr:PhoH family protein [candidate division Zixibacteria bacterium]